LIRLIRDNVRVPDEVVGDIMAQVAANEVGQRKILELKREHGIEELEPVLAEIQARSEASMRRAIEALPDGRYRAGLTLDGYEEPLEIRAEVTIEGSDILVDYTGSSPQTKKAINSVPNYTFAYTAYGLKCVLDPGTPNNAGCFRPIRVTAPLGTILSAVPPAAVNARHLVGNMLPSVMFAALAEIVPERVQADSGGAPLWAVRFHGRGSNQRPFVITLQLSGGQGARYGKHGISALSFPTCASNTPIEIVEALAPLLIECKELIPDSGGRGEWQGGHGQRLAFVSRSRYPIQVSLLTDKLRHPALGLFNGAAGRTGQVLLKGRPVSDTKGRLRLHWGDTLVCELPGGGGMNPLKSQGWR